MFPPRTAPAEPARNTISRTDVQALGLILMILVVIDLPVYRSVLPPKQSVAAVATAHAAPVKKIPTAIALVNRIKSGVSSPTKSLGASNEKTAR